MTTMRSGIWPPCRVTLDLLTSSFHVPIKGLFGKAALWADPEVGAPTAAAIKTVAARNLACCAVNMFSSHQRLFVARYRYGACIFAGRQGRPRPFVGRFCCDA